MEPLHFTKRFLDVILKGLRDGLDLTEEKKDGLGKEIVVRFIGAAFVGVVEWWLMSGMPIPPHVMAEHVKRLIEKNLTVSSSV